MNLRKYFYTALNNPETAFFSFFHQVRRTLPLDYWLGNGFSFYPDFIIIQITQRCNFFCKRCSADSPQFTKKKIKDTELTTSEWKKFIDQVAFFRPSIYFCGGEPTLREDLYELLNYSKSKGLITAFTTNGSLLTSGNIKNIIKAKVDFLSVSIDGQEKIHDKIRGYKGAYKKAVEGIEELLRERKENHLTYPHIKIAAVLDAFDLDNSYYVLDLAKKLKVDEVSFGMLMFYTRKIKRQQNNHLAKGYPGGKEMIGLKVTDNHRFKIDEKRLREFYRVASKQKEVRVHFYAPPEEYFEDYFNINKYPSAESSCTKPWFSALVKANGNVSICQNLVAGNVKEDNLLRIWNRDEFRRFRVYRKKQPNPACFRCSEGQKIKFNKLR